MDNEEKNHEESLRKLLVDRQNFKTPKGYFENFDTSLFSAIDEENIPKQTGFSVPDNYFKEFDVNLLPLKEDGLDISLDPTQNPFKTPANYFENFDTKLTASLSINQDTQLGVKKPQGKVRNLIIGFGSSIAAAFLIYMGIQQYTAEDIYIENITESELNEWILAGNMDIDTYTIASIEPELDDSSTFMYDGISDEDIDDYLDTVDTELLY